jgi:molybdopterin-guanine dinucleotide biosynthesis protein A
MQAKYNTAVIFAGGKSSRMGTDKALLPFGGHNSMAEYLCQKLTKIFQNVYISAKSDKFDFSPTVIIDNYEQSSPMVGLVSIFETIDYDEIFIISVDSPLITQEIIDMLYKNASEHINADAIIATSPDGIEPMCGIYRRTIYPLAKKYLNDDMHQLMKLLKNSTTEYLEFGSNKEFLNLNSPDQYEIAIAKY